MVRASVYNGFHCALEFIWTAGHRDKAAVSGTIPGNPGRLASICVGGLHLPHINVSPPTQEHYPTPLDDMAL